MALEMHILAFGGETDSAIINNDTYADLIASGLSKLGKALDHPGVTFLSDDEMDFPSDGVNTTWVHISLVTVGPDIQPSSQFNVHFLVHHIVDPDTFMGNI